MKKDQMVGTRLPDETVRDLELIEQLEQSDRSTTIRKLLHKAIREWKIEHFARQYGDGTMSLAKAAEEAGVTLWEMMARARQMKINSQYDLEELEADIASSRRKLGDTAEQ